MSNRRHASGDLFLCMRMQRTDNDGDRFDVDMVIYFAVTHRTLGRPARIRYDQWDYPAQPAEYDFEITSIEFDSGPINRNAPPDDAPWPLTDDEDATLREWFDANYDQAYEAAEDRANA